MTHKFSGPGAVTEANSAAEAWPRSPSFLVRIQSLPFRLRVRVRTRGLPAQYQRLSAMPQRWMLACVAEIPEVIANSILCSHCCRESATPTPWVLVQTWLRALPFGPCPKWDFHPEVPGHAVGAPCPAPGRYWRSVTTLPASCRRDTGFDPWLAADPLLCAWRPASVCASRCGALDHFLSGY